MPQFTLLRDDNTQATSTLNFAGYKAAIDPPVVTHIEDTDKIGYLHALLRALEAGELIVLLDPSMTHTVEKVNAILQTKMESTLFLQNAAAIFFTSGTSGNPVGVLKSAEHIMREVKTHKQWLSPYMFEQCLVSVPFFHIYGFLFGLALPLELELDIVTQDHFLPGDFLTHMRHKPTLCITNPVFIRALNRFGEGADLSESLFISSAGALEAAEAKAFELKYNTRLIQLYGSTETGGIAIREGGETKWTPLEGVAIDTHEGRLSVDSPYLSEYLYQERFLPIARPYITTDLVQIVEEGFEIIGRESELIKIGGKRLSVIEIERYLETLEGIKEALVMIEYRPGLLRGELLHLRLRGEAASVDATTIKKLLHDRFGGIHIECKIIMAEEIAKTATGKKIRSALSLT